MQCCSSAVIVVCGTGRLTDAQFPTLTPTRTRTRTRTRARFARFACRSVSGLSGDVHARLRGGRRAH